MMKAEIGSEFWNGSSEYEEKKFFLSGRTALEFVIRDIIAEQEVNSVLLPSYCCHTMIEPFFRHGIKTRFYDVYFDPEVGLCAAIPEPENKEIFYGMKYFGFSGFSGIDTDYIRRAWPVIIEDKTHSWIANDNFFDFDYSYVSYRKWWESTGLACAVKAKGMFICNDAVQTNEEYISLRRNIFELKKLYMEGKGVKKEEFLSLINEAEEMLEKNYVGFLPENDEIQKLLTINTDKLIEKRRKNAFVLINGLKYVNGVSLLFEDVDDKAVPLFVPVFISADRDKVRRALISEGVYCPVHWPLSDFHKISDKAKEIYNCELSIICDQRYSEEDMERIVRVIKDSNV